MPIDSPGASRLVSDPALRDRRVVVLDDDPTGTQAARDVTVLLDPDEGLLGEVLEVEQSVYVQTNSRALSEADAVAQLRSVRQQLDRLSDGRGFDVRVVLRGDSTLRGHVFSESRVMLDADTDAVMLFVPAFPEGGRVTRDGVHLVRRGDEEVPVGETEFARDPVFGFVASDLGEFVRERTGETAVVVDLASVRSGGLAFTLRTAPAGSIIVADAVEPRDIRSIADAVRRAWTTRGVVVRCAASLAAELAEVAAPVLLEPSVLQTDKRILVVCGSHTELARAQLRHLELAVGAASVVDTGSALEDPGAEGRRVAAVEERRHRPGGVRLIATARDRRAEHSSLGHGAAVMQALTTAAAILGEQSALVVTKGGITASDVIHRSLGARRGRVRGQVAPGVSVWDVRTSAGRPVRCLIVPGNMGSESILSDTVRWALAADEAPTS